VYEAVDRASGARVALKTLRLIEPDALLRLKEEFRALADIAHPNLVRLGELLCDEGTWFFTMELVLGQTFVAYVTGEARDDPSHSVVRIDAGRTRGAARGASGRFDEGRLRASLIQLARGLSALHAAGKVHRDIKPSNVLVTNDGRVVILDFGLVRDTATPHDDDGVVGTITHMAPEQAAGGVVRAAADWYAVGTVLYQCLTGRPPFQGGAGEVLRRKQTEDPRSPRTVAPTVPPDLDELCMALLRRDPEARAGAGEMLRRLEPRGSEAPPALGSIAPPRGTFVGRARELAELDAAFAGACAGKTEVVLVTGESGVGKSALVRRFTRGLAPHALVLAGRCYEREDVPYKAVDAVMDALVHHLSSLVPSQRVPLLAPSAHVVAQAFPVLGRVLPLSDEPPSSRRATDRSALFAALRELFARVARVRPLVVAVDDLQWADADGLAVIAELLRPPGAPAMLFVGTARPSAGGENERYGLPERARIVALGRLGTDDAVGLAHLLLEEAGAATSLAKDLAAEARGHPLFLDELVRHARTHADRPVLHVPLDEALYARVTLLEPPERELLEVLAVAGVALVREVAMRAAGLRPADFAHAAQVLRAGHLARGNKLRSGAEAIETYHDRVREAVAARLDPEVRRRWHEGLARALEASQAYDADSLSTHWLGAGDATKAARYARDAAAEAFAAFAFERAARLYERALSLGAEDESGKQAMRVKRAESLTRAGLGALAARGFMDAARTARPEDALDLRRRAAEELLVAGRLDDGDVVLREVLRAVDIRLPLTSLGALAGLIALRFLLLVRGVRFRAQPEGKPYSAFALVRHDACAGVARALALVDTVRGAYFQTRTLLLALSLGEPARVARALAMWAAQIAASGQRRAAETARLLAEARAIAQRSGDAESIGVTEMGAGYAKFVQGHFADGRATLDRAASVLRETHGGASWYLRSAEFGAIWCLAWLGELGELSTRVQRLLREAEHRGDLYARTTLRTGMPNLAFLRRGEAREARALVLDATRRWTQRGYHNQHYWSLLALANIDLYEGDGRAAHARVAREWGRLSRALILHVQIVAIEAIHLRARAAIAGALEEHGTVRARLARHAERCAQRLARIDSPIAQPYVRLVRGGVAGVHGDFDRAVLHLEAAVAGFDAASMMLHASAARWKLAHLRGGDEGRAIRAHAEAWMTAQGVADAAAMARMMAPGFRER
jgi:hypothetical protein